MKRFALIACLLAPAVQPLVLAETPAAPSQEAPAPLAARLRAVLDGLERTHSQDVYDAAALVLAETGEPAAFLPLMEVASKAGSAVATVWLVPRELNRLSVAGASLQDSPRAAELRARVQAAAEKGYRPAFILAANLAAAGVGGKEDEAAATRYLVEGSKKGCPQARAGYLVLSGRLQKEGTKGAAAAAELERRNFYLEELLAQAAGDTAEGVAWLRRAAEHGSAVAPYMLTQSREASLAEQEAMPLLELAASRHHPEAMGFLGNIRLHADELRAGAGLSLKEDTAGGLHLLQMAAALGDADSAQSLAAVMLLGKAGAASAAQVCALYRMAAEQGDPQGLAGYGYCLMAGRGCTADAVRGEEMLRLAQERGAQWGYQALASAYFNGLGVKPDMRRAVNLLGEDAAMGAPHAYAIMAAITALGNDSAAPDPTRARIYLDMAVAEGVAGAQEIYDAILSDGKWRFLPQLWEM